MNLHKSNSTGLSFQIIAVLAGILIAPEMRMALANEEFGGPQNAPDRPFKLFQFDAFSMEPVLPDEPFSTTGRETEPNLEKYPHIFSTDVWDRDNFWYTPRATIFQEEVPANWDPMKLINTDRPDFTDVATVVGKGVTQFETGWSYRNHGDPAGAFDRNTLPEILVRHGINDRFEWRIKWDLGWTNTTYRDYATGQSQTVDGSSDIQLGFKRILVDQDDWVPLQTVVTRLWVPTGSQAYSANTIQGGFTYIYNWQVRRWWFIRGATGCDWLTTPVPVFGPPGMSPQPISGYQRDSNILGSQSISSYFQLTQQIGMFAEWFMFFHQGLADNRDDNFLDYGWYYYITPNLQLDARIGWRLGGTNDEYFTGAGLSWRRNN